MTSQLRKVHAPGSAPPPEVASVNEQRILQHALHSFATRGYAATGLRAIAADAQLTAPMVNYYFKTKEALYQRVGAMVMDGLVAAVGAACAEGGTLTQVLTGNLLGHLQFGADLPEAVRFLFGLFYGPEEGRPGVDLGVYAAVEARIQKAFERAIRSGAFVLHAGVTRADAFELYQGFVMSLVMHDTKAPSFGKPRTEPRTASRRLGILLAGLGTLHA
jgi:AcrR family transcriptional regulator